MAINTRRTTKHKYLSSSLLLFLSMTLDLVDSTFAVPMSRPPPPFRAMSNSSDEYHDVSNNKNDTTDEMRQVMKTLESSLIELGSKASPRQVDSIAQFLQNSMEVPSRNYHRLSHVLHVALLYPPSQDGIYQLAGLFHDVIYMSADGGLILPQQTELLRDVSSPNGTPLLFHSCNNNTNDLCLQMVMQVFGIDFSKNKETPPPGWNEFLSAVAVVRLLEPLLELKHLIQIAVCIEATIPFRPPGILQDLYERLQKANDEYHLQLSDQECIVAIERAATMANRDVDNFAYKDAALFLDKTWQLLPELNLPLRNNLFTALDYQEAIYKMHGFFQKFLNPQHVFKEFGIVSTKQETQQAQINVEIAKKYLGAKLLSASVLSAISILAGANNEPMQKLIVGNNWNNMPTFEKNKSSSCDLSVYNVLHKGRASEISFDTRESPLAAMLYWNLGNNGVEELIEEIHPMDSTRAQSLLQSLPQSLLKVVVDQIIQNVPSQKEVLLRSLSDSL